VECLKIKYQTTNNFSELVVDYLNKNEKLQPFINHFPSLENLEKQIVEKQKHKVNRSALVKVLKEQNSSIILSKNSDENIEFLLDENTFTITTGHQLCLFTGPLYFIYKIISSINLVEQLKDKYPEKNFVPIFWMASEDHDFEEVNHINLFGRKISWESEQYGAVGRMKLNGFQNVLDELKQILGESENAQKLIQLFENAYLNHNNLSEASRYLLNKLFGRYGLVILDADDKRLKKQFISVIKKDVVRKGFVTAIQNCSNELSKYYKIQAYARDINFFKLSDNKRELIKESSDMMDIEKKPEQFSPNVLMRPLYQEMILPNIAYIGGGAEVSYWMQLRTAFEQEDIPFPILLLRNSAMIINSKQNQKIKDFGFKIEDLFLSEDELKKQYILSQSQSDISLEDEKTKLENIYNTIAKRTSDIGFKNRISAQLKKQINTLNDLEQKFIREEKKKYKDSLNQIERIKNQLFPNNRLQERHDNFIPFYLKDGEKFIEMLKDNFEPLYTNFVVLEIMSSK
jgi:bacillithiol biosynthesis cysteine-adding enzyme BshC